MKKILAAFTVLLITNVIIAQVKLPIKLVATPAALNEAIKGLANEYANAKGDAVVSAPQQTEYISKIVWPESETNVIVSYAKGKGSSGFSNVSWQSTILTTESFASAEKAFKKTFKQIDGATITYEGKSCKLKADFEKPDESVGFTTIVFEAGEDKKLQVLLEIKSDNINWQIVLNVFEIPGQE
jgi:hypothetical protein